MESSAADLTPRKREILRRVVEEYVLTGQPVGSRHLVDRGGLRVSPSTVRSELAELEQCGLLSHPYTSAGRMPTERGYRLYAHELLGRLEPRPTAFPLELEEGPSELEPALQAATERLSEVTRLLALVSAPPIQATTIRHVEVLLLQPRVVMVVVITATGGVSKRRYTFGEPVDPGLTKWAKEYLNERIAGLHVGTHLLRQRLEAAELSPRERDFLDVLRPTLTALLADEQRLFVGGAAGLLDDVRAEELIAYRRLLELLEKRAALLALLRDALDPARPFIRVGQDLDVPALQNAALVGVAYGTINRALGAVSLLGPSRMDYEKAVRTVRAVARELSRVAEDVYSEP
jgi:heat-inducible transcriptional repressor